MGLLLLVIVWQWGSAAWIFTKAELAQWLIANAWDNTLMQPAIPDKPWPWADTWPVARLQMLGRDVDLYVLEGAQGNSLAFGPGHHQGTALPGEGMSVIGGHRDTHFRFLKTVVGGDELLVQTVSGRVIHYRVRHIEVVDINRQALQITPNEKGMLLVTCYPFDTVITQGPLRLLVWLDEIDGPVRPVIAVF